MNPYYETPNGQLYCGDCLEVMAELTEDVSLVIIDPPYSSGARQTNQLRARKGMLRSDKWADRWFGTDNLSTSALMFFMRGSLLCSYNMVKNGGHLYTFIDWRNYPIMANIVESAGWRINNMVVWDKVHFGMGHNYRNQHELIIFCSKGKPSACNRHDIGNVISSKRLRQNDHPTEKPTDLVEKFIEMSSSEGDIVLDYFMGSGTTAVACEKLNRKWIGIEISEEYCEIAAKRIEESNENTSN